MFMEMDSRMNPQAQAMTAPSNGSFARKGTATIAGTACTIYDVVHDGQTATSCITSDGLALRSTSQDGRGIEATKVEYGALPASYFQAPSDYRKMDMPAMGGQMGGPMGGMMGRPPR